MTEWLLRPSDTAAVPAVRHGIMDLLRQQAASESDLWSAEIIVAEVLSNAVTHTSGPAFVSLRWEGDHPVLSVWGDGPGPALVPAPSEPPDVLADGGRGLYLVASLALDVSVARRSGRSQVNVKLDIARTV